MPDENQTIEYKQLLDNGEPFYPMVGKSSYSEWIGYEEVSGDPPTDNFVLGIANGGTGSSGVENISTELLLTQNGGSSNIEDYAAYKWGNIISIQFRTRLTGSVASGSNVFTGSINKFFPFYTVSAVAYNGVRVGICTINSTGGVTVRQVLDTIDSGASYALSIVFLTEG